MNNTRSLKSKHFGEGSLLAEKFCKTVKALKGVYRCLKVEGGGINKNYKINKVVTEFTFSLWWKMIIFSHDYSHSISVGTSILYKRREFFFLSVQFSSVTQSCPTLCDPMNRSMPGLPVHHQLPEFTQTHVHQVGDAIQPFHPLSSPSPPAPNPSQHQSLFQ